MRSLSHGCVRVQEWEKLAYNIVRYDNEEKYPDTASPAEDSLTTWLQRKEKHIIPVRKKLPVFIRYFTCEGKNGKLIFYDDIYGEDKACRKNFLPESDMSKARFMTSQGPEMTWFKSVDAAYFSL